MRELMINKIVMSFADLEEIELIYIKIVFIHTFVSTRS